MPDLTVRDATIADAEAIARIYNQGIEDRVATLETSLRTAEERRDWLSPRTGTRGVPCAPTARTCCAMAAGNTSS